MLVYLRGEEFVVPCHAISGTDLIPERLRLRLPCCNHKTSPCFDQVVKQVRVVTNESCVVCPKCGRSYLVANLSLEDTILVTLIA